MPYVWYCAQALLYFVLLCLSTLTVVVYDVLRATVAADRRALALHKFAYDSVSAVLLHLKVTRRKYDASGSDDD